MKKSIKINALLNIVKQVMQIIFPIITIPYITRVLLPENYGRINTGNSVISYISLIAGLGIASYAVREGSLVRDDEKRLNVLSNQIFSINIISTLIAYLILIGIILFVPHYAEYKLLLAIQGVTVVFNTIGADWINTIEEDYLYITVRYIILHIISLILMFAFVRKPEDYYIYAIICLITSAGANIMNVFYVRKYVKIRFTLDINWKKHFIPIMVLFGNAVAMTIYVSSDITMLEYFKGPEEVGLYSVAAKIYSIVKQILNAVIVVSVPRMTSYIATDDYKCFTSLGRNIFNALITLMSPIIIGVIIFRKEAIILAGGEKYIAGTGNLLILSLAVSASLVATFFSGSVLMPLRKEKYLLYGTIISAIINFVLNFVFIPALGGNGAAATTLISETFVALCFYLVVRKEGYHFLEWRVFVLSIIGGGLVALVCLVIKFIFDSLIISVGLSILLSCFIYFVVQIVGKNRIVIELLPWKNKRQ